MKRSFIREILEHTNNKTISFAGGLPDNKLFPIKDIRELANKVLQEPTILQYSKSTGLIDLKEQIASFYTKDGFETTAKNILITSGSQQALDIITRYYQNREITIEEPSYLGALNIFKLNSLKPMPIKLKHNGISINAFKKSFKSSKLAYLIPDFQNPTGTLYSLKKREKVAKIVKEYDGVLIEDAPYSKLYFNKKPQSISSLIPNNSFHLGTFSKTLAPALRVGWIRASKELLEPLIAYKEAMDLHTNTLSQAIISNYIKSKKYDIHLENLRESYQEKMEFFSKQLDIYLPSFKYKKPKGGMFIYGKLKNIDTAKLIQKALKENIAFVPGSEFYVKNPSYNEIRFNFSNTSKEDIILGLEKMAKLI